MTDTAQSASLLAFLRRIARRSTIAAALVADLAASPAAAQSAEAPDIRQTLDRRCVVCHGCYDAPCQLKLSSADGLRRGATKERVYYSSRLEDAPMTRLGIDARTIAGWRKRGFFTVTDENTTTGGPGLLEQLLVAGNKAGFSPGAALPGSIDLDINRQLACPAPDEVSDYLKDHPQGGMPYAMATLPARELEALLAWARQGAPLKDPAPVASPAAAAQIAAVEAYLNRDEPREKLVARYVYEHLFLAHLHLEDDTSGRFYRLVRSRTPSGEPPDEIASRRPFDDPGQPEFYYRLMPIAGTILHKEHMTYRLGPQRLKRYDALFFAARWPLDSLPAYSNSAGGNPMSTFAAIPAAARYRFLLDDAEYFVRSFIRGPVCYGQVAVNVIEDRFWVTFLDPDSDLSVTDPSYLAAATPILELPVAKAEGDLEDRLQAFLTLGPVAYQAFRQERYARQWQASGGPDHDDIWHGDGENTGARLTIYRHFSSASVVSGFVGAVPKTAWVIDYPLFERIYYDLVAGFDVFGNVEHQLTTRIYMDTLRREGERIFLSFLPPGSRVPLHDNWYRGQLASLIDLWREHELDTSTPTGITFTTDAPKAEFLTALMARGGGLWPQTDPINRCGVDCAQPETSAGALRPLTMRPAPFAKFLPDLALVLVPQSDGRAQVFTLVHDKAHTNVAFLFNEDARREPDKDSLTVVEGQFGSYPNFFFKVGADALPAFASALAAVRSQADYLQVVERFGIRRTHPDFWATFDLAQAALDAQDPIEAGLLDLNRYKDPKPNDPILDLFGFSLFGDK